MKWDFKMVVLIVEWPNFRVVLKLGFTVYVCGNSAIDTHFLLKRMLLGN